MLSIFPILTLLCNFLALAVLAEPAARLLFADDDILLKLDYATYRGYYNNTNEVNLSYPHSNFDLLTYHQVYTFRNIRFAAPPVGDLRWAKPTPPPKTSGIQDRTEALACTQPPLTRGTNCGRGGSGIRARGLLVSRPNHSSQSVQESTGQSAGPYMGSWGIL